MTKTVTVLLYLYLIIIILIKNMTEEAKRFSPLVISRGSVCTVKKMSKLL